MSALKQFWRRDRYLFATIFFLCLPVGLLFITPRAPRNGLLWDFAMGAGFAAMGLMLVLPILSTRIWFSYRGDARQAIDILRAHRVVSYLALCLMAVHIAVLLVIDPIVIEYLKPSAPWPMLAALASTVIFIVVIVQSEFRIQLNLRYLRWRRWHGFLSMLCLLGAAYHVIAAHYFVNTTTKLLVFAIVCGFFSSGIYLSGRRYRRSTDSLVRHIAPDGSYITRMTIYVSILILAVSFIYSIPPPGNRAEQQVMQCVLERC